ncbi:hypothetical protein D3C73_1539690 [compost metagenome]
MTSLGLKCVLLPKTSNDDEEEDADSNGIVVTDTSIVIRRDTIINVKKDGITIQKK